MSSEREPDRALERQVHELLRTLPARRAPEQLMARVLGELERRAALPWWRRQVMQWPIAARLSFAVLAAALMLLSLAGSARVSNITHATAPMLTWGQHVMATLSVVPRLINALVGLVPMVWLQAILAIAVLAYLLLFGLGAAAYRLLYLER